MIRDASPWPLIMVILVVVVVAVCALLALLVPLGKMMQAARL